MQLLSEKAGEEEVEKTQQQHASASTAVDSQPLDADDAMPMTKRKRARKLVEDYKENKKHDKGVKDDNDMNANDEDDDDKEMKMMNKLKQGKEKKKKRISKEAHQTETLLNYLIEAAASSDKKPGYLELDKRKKWRYNKKVMSSPTIKEADQVEESLLWSLVEYKKSFLTHASIQFFLLTK